MFGCGGAHAGDVMTPGLRDFLKRWVTTTVGVLVSAHIVPGIGYDKENWLGLVLATLVLGILNALIRPILVLLSLPLVIITLGLFTVVINAMLLFFVGWLFKDSFEVLTFGAALLGALVISVVSGFLNFLTGTHRIRLVTHHTATREGRPGKGRRNGDGEGPVIDV